MIMSVNGWQKLKIQSWYRPMVHLNPLPIDYLITVIPDFKKFIENTKNMDDILQYQNRIKNKFARGIAIQYGSSSLINKYDKLIHKRINTLMTVYHKP